MHHEAIREIIGQSVKVISSLTGQVARIDEMTQAVVGCLRNGGKILTAGNGGSAAEALHLAEECVGRYRASRVALPAIALVADSTALTCIGNDFGFDQVFSRSVEALGKPGDLLILFSTSGNSVNLRPALEAARQRRLTTMAFLGRDGGLLRGLADMELVVAADDTARIQEAHQLLVHLLLQAVEEAWVPADRSTCFSRKSTVKPS